MSAEIVEALEALGMVLSHDDALKLALRAELDEKPVDSFSPLTEPSNLACASVPG